MKRFFIYLIFCFASVAFASAQNVIVRAEVDSMMMWIGQQTGLRLEVTCDTGQDVAFPAYSDTIVTAHSRTRGRH